ncbi:MAG: sugar phosphate isomerase/epimerase [Lachnospiraceae bacterium]|nr:sugar phosphate isomerase/epimerase [Lachnospiraceae bacterium]
MNLKDRLYISTIAPNAYDLAQEFRLGLELAEYCTAYNMDTNPREIDQKIRSGLSPHQPLFFHGPFSELFPCAIDPLIRQVCHQRFLQSIKKAADLGCQKIVFHGGFNPLVYFPIWYVEQSPAFWQELLQEVPADVHLYIENVLEPDPSYLADILEAVGDSRLQMCLDIGHAGAYSQLPVQDWIRRCRHLIGHVHLHNNDGCTDLHQGLQKGQLPVWELLAQLQEECPAASITLEIPDSAQARQSVLDLKPYLS